MSNLVKMIPEETVFAQTAIKEHLPIDLVENVDFMLAVRENLAHLLAAEILRAGFISFHTKSFDKIQFETTVQAKVGVVHPTEVVAMEKRIAEHQEKIAKEVVEEATTQIKNWGSDFGWENIKKDMAYKFLREALDKVTVFKGQTT